MDDSQQPGSSKRRRTARQPSSSSQCTQSTRSIYENSWENDMRTGQPRDQTIHKRHEESFESHSSGSKDSNPEYLSNDLISSTPLHCFAQDAPLPRASSSYFRLPRAPDQFQQLRITYNSRSQQRTTQENDQRQTGGPIGEILSSRRKNAVHNLVHVQPENLSGLQSSPTPLELAVFDESSYPQTPHIDFSHSANPIIESLEEEHAPAASDANNEAAHGNSSKTLSNYSVSSLHNTYEYSSTQEHVLVHGSYNDGKERELLRLMDIINIVEYSGMSKNQSRALLETNILHSRYSYDA
ncbi:hypothetical protein FGB62_39g14 [Gracilaria domingensis]|nr:hypothetical protein FGB62_39g14 [Gracilaria domingensis]